MKTIRVTGKGQIKIRPDMTRITMTLEGTDPNYDEILRRSAEDTVQLKELLGRFGFEKEDIKTINFSVDTEYEHYRENDVFKSRFVGYKFQHVLKIEFGSDNERLGKILYALAKCSVKPEFRLSYTVKDEEAAKNDLLGKAVIDSQKKAAVLTQAAGVALKDIQSIDYSWGQINFEVQSMSRMAREEGYYCMDLDEDSRSYDVSVEPDDIEISDTVTVIWQIA